MLYLAHLKQPGQGCDYTIGCAQTVIYIDAQSMDEAELKLYQEFKENYTGERELRTCLLHEVNSVRNYDLRQFYESLKEEAIGINIQEQEEADRAEYIRLKSKYGGK